SHIRVFQYDPDTKTVHQPAETIAGSGIRVVLSMAGDGNGMLNMAWSAGNWEGSVSRITPDGDSLNRETCWTGRIDMRPDSITFIEIEWHEIGDLSGLDGWTAPDSSEPPAEKEGYEVREDLRGGSYYIHEFNGADQEIRQTWHFMDGSAGDYIEYKYNSAGEQIKQTNYDADGTLEYAQDYYSAVSYYIDTSYNADGSISYYAETEWDMEANHPIRMTGYNTDGDATFSVEYKYDSAGEMIKKIHYDGEGNIQSYLEIEREYDSDGNQINYKETWYNGDGSPMY
ncbi:MAG: hypothetical protein NC389_16825, partial [Acetatifactor muris]|nr:hypothetical protein [Acetatifactor muris]